MTRSIQCLAVAALVAAAGCSSRKSEGVHRRRHRDPPLPRRSGKRKAAILMGDLADINAVNRRDGFRAR
jgi:hypothetical protein